MWKYIQAVRRVETIGRFWVHNWNALQGKGAEASQKSIVEVTEYEERGPRLHQRARTGSGEGLAPIAVLLEIPWEPMR
jgi:hypothetical protein